MNVPPRRDPPGIALLCRAYACLLHLYPRAHRARWAAEMQQAFRDGCRETARDGRGPGRWLLGVALPDLLANVLRERLTTMLPQRQGDLIMRSPAHLILAIAFQVAGSALLAVSVIGLVYAIHGGRFSHPGAFDALMALQVGFGAGGVALLAIGIRQVRPKAACLT